MDPATPSASVVPIFATPFGVLPLPQGERLNPDVAQLLEARAAAGGGAAGTGPLCYVSRDDLLEATDAPLRALTEQILRGLWSIVATINDPGDAELASLALHARGWFTIVRPDGCVPAMSHPLTSWCAIYCVEAPVPAAERRDSGVLRLYEGRLGTMFRDPSSARLRIPYTPGHYTWRPQAGQLVVFPGSLTHEIALVRSQGQLMLLSVRARFARRDQPDRLKW